MSNDAEPARDPLDGVATLDLQRTRRRGFPEAVYCEGKTVEHVERIARSFAGTRPDGPVLFTRADADRAAAVLRALPDARHEPVARLVVWPPEQPDVRGGSVLVVTAGTSDIPVAREAALTATYLGCQVAEATDVGVAGLHRILGKLAQPAGRRRRRGRRGHGRRPAQCRRRAWSNARSWPCPRRSVTEPPSAGSPPC